MNVKVVDSEGFEPVNMMVDVNAKLMVCAHCSQCLNQLVWSPNKLNVVVYYRNEKGESVEWKPDEYKQSLIQWLEREKYPRDYWKTCETGGRYFCLCGARIGKKDGRCIYCQTPYNQAIDKVIQHIKGGEQNK